MNPVLTTLIVVAFVGLLVLRHVVFERNMRRARENGTGIYRYSPHVRRIIVVAVLIAVVPLEIWQSQANR